MDRDSWEDRWERALLEHGDRLDSRPPNAYVTGELTELDPGRALDAGCGHGAESLWLAARGWHVTAVDFSPTALARARVTARTMGVDVDWIEADLGTWSPEPEAYDLVVSLYVHVAGEVAEFIDRMASGVAPGGTVFLTGHQEAPGQVQVSVDDAKAFDSSAWCVVAEERTRPDGRGVDAVIRARRASRDAEQAS